MQEVFTTASWGPFSYRMRSLRPWTPPVSLLALAVLVGRVYPRFTALSNVQLATPGSVLKWGNDHIRLLPIVSSSLTQCAQHDHTYCPLTESNSSFFNFSTVMTIDNFSSTIALIFAGCISSWSEASGVITIPARAYDSDILQAATVSGPLIM